MDSSTTGLIDRRAQTLIGQHLPSISLVSNDLMLILFFWILQGHCYHDYRVN